MLGCSKKRHGLWLAGFLLLLATTALHSFEHWEIAAHADCISHSSDSKNASHPDHASSESGSRHHHGCTSHDHSVAVLEKPLVLQVHPSIETLSLPTESAPPAPSGEIDLPPNLI